MKEFIHSKGFIVLLLISSLIWIIAVILLGNYLINETHHTTAIIAFCAVLASYIAIILLVYYQTNSTYKTIRANSSELNILYQISLIANSSLDINDIMEQGLRKSVELLKLKGGGIYLLDEAGKKLVIAKHYGLSDEFINQVRSVKISEGTLGKVAEPGQIQVIQDASVLLGEPQSHMVKEGIKRIISVPLKSKGALHGIINVAGGDDKQFTARDIDLMAIIGNILGEAVNHAKVYQQIKQANIELSKLNEMKANFISMVTHELRTPLMVVKEGINACHAKITDPVILNNCTFARISVERLLRLIDNLWGIARIEAGKIELNRKSTEVGTLIKTSVNLLETLIRNKELTLNIDVPESLPLIFVDTDKILQIILNLLDNAIKFTSAGGQITIRAYQINESSIEVSIKDSGVGMSAEESTEIFSEIPALTENGLGKLGVIRLGLRICKLLLEMHGGKITVESEPLKGSNFRFTLPVLIPRVS